MPFFVTWPDPYPFQIVTHTPNSWYMTRVLRQLRKIKSVCPTTSSEPVLSWKPPVLFWSFWDNHTQQFFDSDFYFVPQKNPELAVLWFRRDLKNQNPVVIKEIDTHPTLLRTLGPYDTFANPWSNARNTRSIVTKKKVENTNSKPSYMQ
jgi:hypothetical protein